MSTTNIGINQLPVTNEIVNGDYLIIDNGTETRRLDFKDFIVGLENVTFASTISSNSSDISALSTNTINISALSAISTNISTLTTTVNTNTINISALSATSNVNVSNINILSATATTNTTNISALSSALFGQVPTSASIAASTHYIKLRINNSNYAIMLSAIA